jgi:hypothetical protein
MGSTGRYFYDKSDDGNLFSENFKIGGAVTYKGKVPEGSGLDPVGGNKITIKVPADDKTNILFQFKLSKDSKLMTILAYKNGVPEVRCKVAVDSGKPSLDAIMKNGTSSQKLQATKMRNLFSRSTEVKENQLGSIANKLLENKRKREGDTNGR